MEHYKNIFFTDEVVEKFEHLCDTNLLAAKQLYSTISRLDSFKKMPKIEIEKDVFQIQAKDYYILVMTFENKFFIIDIYTFEETLKELLLKKVDAFLK